MIGTALSTLVNIGAVETKMDCQFVIPGLVLLFGKLVGVVVMVKA